MAEHGDRFLDAPEAAWLALFRDRAVAHVLELIRGDLAAIDIDFDVWSSEKALYECGDVDRFLAELDGKGLVYQGSPPAPRIAGRARPAPQLAAEEEGVAAAPRSSRSSGPRSIGDEVDRPVKKADGTPTYFCADIAYHWQKRQRADALVDVLGADHGGYVPRLEAALAGARLRPATTCTSCSSRW